VSVAWNPDGNQLASGGGIGDSAIRIWDYDPTGNSFTLNTTISLSNNFVRVSRVSWSPDGIHLAGLGILDAPTADELIAEARIWDTNSWELKSRSQDHFVSPTRSLTWSPDSSLVAGGGRTSCYDERRDCPGRFGGVFQLNATDGSLTHGYDLAIVPTFVSWSPRGQIAFGAFGLSITDGATNEYLYYWDVAVSQADWSPEGDKIVVDRVGTLQILDIQTGEILRSFDPSGLWSLDWSPDGNRIATGSADGIVEVWDTSNLPDVSGSPTLTLMPTYTPTPAGG
jgi:WD40 repeat protein